ncbi:hypothetical protein WMY93_002016 [Mugilogobius chulae]|uniref:Globoside alpha-1,3-N-acetylgalactosaminyltransferase 1 n=1 Tax=Mugilogobius chulae TaxID=88201 RepID=A0AAW0Q0Y4_9GOBI
MNRGEMSRKRPTFVSLSDFLLPYSWGFFMFTLDHPSAAGFLCHPAETLKNFTREASSSHSAGSSRRGYVQQLYIDFLLSETEISPVRRPVEETHLDLFRIDVNTVTNWNAPLVWEGTFDPELIDHIYTNMNPRIAVLVLAVGKYTRFIKGFLESGEKHFFVGFRVTYYIFTDKKEEVPNINLAPGRNVSVLDVPSANRWQDVVLSKMKWATVSIENWLHKEADYLFMMDIDSVFHNRFGAESLSRLTAVLHRGYYKRVERDAFPYERRPQSQAYIPFGEGDFYYTAAVWGGHMDEMYKLVKYCDEKAIEDTKNGIEAAWQEESHLNKYFLYYKPSKVLSPEYLWSDYDEVPKDIRVVRISQLVKNYAEVRPNGGQ